MGQLASAADGLKANSSGLITRYDNNSAAASATSYRYAINGQLLYIASQIDAHAANSAVGTGMKTVAYLYAIDGDMSGANTAYFFTPTASGLLAGDDTGKGVDSNPNKTSATNPDDNYAANNPTINMGYMGTLPFVTNTYDSGVAYVTTTVYDDAAGHDETVSIPGIVMKVEDIYKANPACTLSIAANATDQALKDVDVIIFNSTTATSLNGTSGGKNSSYVVNTTPLTANAVVSWAARHGFSGTVLSGDDFGTSNNQWDANGTRNDGNQAPLLYCQRNYTADKNARAAWAFSKVYPELYKLNGVEKANATYGYWVDKIYHVNTSDVNTVAGILTNQNPNDFAYSADICAMVENNAVTGYAWWTNQSHNLSIWDSYKFYTGSTRASYYSGDSDSEEQLNTIEIFGPTNS